MNEEALAQWGLSRQKKTKKLAYKIVHYVYVKGEITDIYVGVEICTGEGYAL